MKDILRIGMGTGLMVTVSFATAPHATSAVRTAEHIAGAFLTSEGGIPAQFVVPDQFVPGPAPTENSDIAEGEAPAGTGAFSGVSVASTPATVAIVQELEKGTDLCERAPEAYAVDCLALNYRETARKLSSTGDYGEARQVLLNTADQLDALVRSNRDRTQPRIDLKETSDGPKLNTRALIPVKPQSVDTVKRQAVPILEEAATKLLRSSSANSTHYQRIAAAVDSNKVLLRSS